MCSSFRTPWKSNGSPIGEPCCTRGASLSFLCKLWTPASENTAMFWCPSKLNAAGLPLQGGSPVPKPCCSEMSWKPEGGPVDNHSAPKLCCLNTETLGAPDRGAQLSLLQPNSQARAASPCGAWRTELWHAVKPKHLQTVTPGLKTRR